MSSYYTTVVVQWLANVPNKCKNDGSNPVSVKGWNYQAINMKEFTRE